MQSDLLSSSRHKASATKAKREEEIINTELIFGGINEDITESYFWHMNFAYYANRGYFTLKLEDHHYFSEVSQFGGNLRQVKGGSIRAFQENLNQLVQLIKVHMMPLLKEVKEAHFYKTWIDRIVENDIIVQEELKKTPSGNVRKNNDRLRKAESERDEAISHIKDKWVNEIDQGRLWQMNKSAAEGGLDFALLPQLFFGTKLDNPLYELHKEGLTLKEQLDDYIYNIDITEDAKLQVARFHYRFLTWLPSAIRETKTTFNIKLAALKQFYAQLQMYIDFMKPLLREISQKKESFESNSMYKGFESEHPSFLALLDTSHSFSRLLGVKGLEKDIISLEELEFLEGGFFIESKENKKGIMFGKCAGKNAFIVGDETKSDGIWYKVKLFNGSRENAAKLSKGEVNKLKEEIIPREDLKVFTIIEFEFSQQRRSEQIQTQQGPQLLPVMKNRIGYKGFAWNLYEIATYRLSVKEESLELLETFIGEISVIKEELLYYVQGMKGDAPWEKAEKYSQSKKEEKKSSDSALVKGPIEGFGELFSPLIPSFKKKERNRGELKKNFSEAQERHHRITKLVTAEDTYKCYSVHKKTHGYIDM